MCVSKDSSTHPSQRFSSLLHRDIIKVNRSIYEVIDDFIFILTWNRNFSCRPIQSFRGSILFTNKRSGRLTVEIISSSSGQKFNCIRISQYQDHNGSIGPYSWGIPVMPITRPTLQFDKSSCPKMIQCSLGSQ